MSTLLLRLAAPFQSWGIDSKFERRNTGRSPSKSGVLGLCAAALGYKRHDDTNIGKMINLRFGVRIDKPGTLIRDFHMAHEEEFWDKEDRTKINHLLSQSKKNTISYLTNRYYLADAAFLAGLEGDETLLKEIEYAIRYPMFPIFLGRRACPPEGRVCLGIFPDPLQVALEKYPSISGYYKPNYQKNYKPRIVIDADNNEHIKGKYLLRDVPQSYNPIHRKHGFRNVCEFDTAELKTTNDHDPIAAIEGV